MINAIIIQTNGETLPFEFSSTNWKTCVEEMGGMPSNTKATLVRVAGTTQGRNLELNSESVLPAGGTSYLIAFTQDKMKGAYELDFSADDVAEMSHREMVMTCKELRASGNDSVKSIVGDYTRDTSDTLRNKLYEVIKSLTVDTTTTSTSDVTREEFDVLKARVLAVETEFLMPTPEVLGSIA